MQLIGHTAVLDQFRRALARGRLASTFLFVGPSGIGKRKFALFLAQSLLCERRLEEKLDPCGECPSCHQVLAGTHPDVHTVAKPTDKAFIPVELLIGDKEHRMRAGLCYDISLKPYSGRRKVAIIDDADYFNKEGANCLLKTLEEPPPHSVLILLGTSEQRQLPTIRSRCQVVRFAALVPGDVAAILLEQGLCDDAAVAEQAAGRSEGSVEAAVMWCDERLAEFRAALFELLSQREFDLPEAAKIIGQFAEEGGKESIAKRARLRMAIGLAEDFYRAALLQLAGGKPASGIDAQLADALARLLRWLPGEEAAGACLEICLAAATHIDSNANQALLIDWWLDELATAARTGRVAV